MLRLNKKPLKLGPDISPICYGWDNNTISNVRLHHNKSQCINVNHHLKKTQSQSLWHSIIIIIQTRHIRNSDIIFILKCGKLVTLGQLCDSSPSQASPIVRAVITFDSHVTDWTGYLQQYNWPWPVKITQNTTFRSPQARMLTLSRCTPVMASSCASSSNNLI